MKKHNDLTDSEYDAIMERLSGGGHMTVSESQALMERLYRDGYVDRRKCEVGGYEYKINKRGKAHLRWLKRYA